MEKGAFEIFRIFYGCFRYNYQNNFELANLICLIRYVSFNQKTKFFSFFEKWYDQIFSIINLRFCFSNSVKG